MVSTISSDCLEHPKNRLSYYATVTRTIRSFLFLVNSVCMTIDYLSWTNFNHGKTTALCAFLKLRTNISILMLPVLVNFLGLCVLIAACGLFAVGPSLKKIKRSIDQ